MKKAFIYLKSGKFLEFDVSSWRCETADDYHSRMEYLIEGTDYIHIHTDGLVIPTKSIEYVEFNFKLNK